MKRSIKSLIGYIIGASDGEIGKVKEFYFDDKTWTIRYLIVETGNWLLGRKVLISPESLLPTDWENGIFPSVLTMEQIKNSPDIDTDKPVSRQEEIKLYAHYPWSSYWDDDYKGERLPISMYQVLESDDGMLPDKNSDDDSHLRSTDEVMGDKIHAIDGEIGEVVDFLIDDSLWKIDYIVVDNGNWLIGRKVVMSPKWIKESG